MDWMWIRYQCMLFCIHVYSVGIITGMVIRRMLKFFFSICSKLYGYEADITLDTNWVLEQSLIMATDIK